MYCTFSKEPSFGMDATTQDFIVDLISEEIITNVNYVKNTEFNSPTAKGRTPRVKSSGGRVNFEMTYGNDGWNTLFEVLVGKKDTLTDFAFAKSSEHWRIVTGQLAGNIDATETSFNITEFKAGEFDSVDGIIVGGEYIAITTISNGVVSVSLRNQEGTTASSHIAQDLVYGVVASGGNSIDLIYRYRDGFCYYLTESLTMLINRSGDYFKFNGVTFSDFVFNSVPESEGTTSSFQVSAINTDVIELASPSTAADSNQMLSSLDINCYSMNSWLDIEKIYFQISNTLNVSPSKFLDTTPQKIFMQKFSSYGQFSLVEESLAAYNKYIGDTMQNLSVTMTNGRQFNNAYVFSFNNIRYGTMLHVLRDDDLITDSVPFYSYGPDKFFMMIQS